MVWDGRNLKAHPASGFQCLLFVQYLSCVQPARGEWELNSASWGRVTKPA